ncbi:MAG TPA: hypothetical protein VJ836_00800 [Candidatus Saccharimonadales bacterium]|nr:hypothetical protein [Candidatus Saccharimonadales bacterium]
MSLVNNSASVAFAGRYSTDKIVGVWEGSFNRATDVITRTGDLGTIYLYRIAHGYARPIAADLLWSTDNVTFADGGSSDGTDISIPYSDNTYVYIISSLFAPAVGTMYYKLIGNWIDNYDNTNPLVNSYISSNKNILFDTRENYQKIYDQNVLSFTSASTQTVTHGLNRLANFRVFYEAFAGEIWPAYAGGASNPFLFDTAMTECDARMKVNTLEVELLTVPSTRRAWYKIYLDV